MTSFNTSSVWNSVQSNVPHAMASASSGMASVSSSVASATDPTSLLNTQLASALSTMGDAQFWEESISPSTIRTSLSTTDPSNPNSTPTLLRGMKWLLACMSKGRDVSDFYPHVVKLVGAPSLEVRKMVYMYLVQYADHDASTRELSLLSINSFQRGLADSEQLIRALALRVLSSIRISDILQIQILGVQKCARDKSPYVRKCAANALAKLSPRCDAHQREMLLEIMKTLLDEDTSTMVLTSTITAFAELCPDRLDLLHSSYRKVCHLLTDMDEWGQVVVIDTLARYCRRFFREPRAMKEGSAEVIDRERRVRRTVSGVASHVESSSVAAGLDALTTANLNGGTKELPPRRNIGPKKIKRRVVKKGFYSDEEDESTEEEVYADEAMGTPLSVATAMRQRNIMGLGGEGGVIGTGPLQSVDEDGELAEDHRLLLRSSLSLLKSRNSGVVLAVCSLHYYCGVSSVKVRSALGKALVRIHRDRREIQYVVLASIRTLVTECPSAFTPFLNDFFVKAMDPSFTRMIKLDILTSLALEPASIEAVLKELRNYIRHDDKAFVCASIRAVGKVVELARIVHDRYGNKKGHVAKERKEANRVALNCLYGLMALTQACENEAVVGECAIVMERIMLRLMSESGEGGELMKVEDSNHVQQSALRRLTLLLVRSLSSSLEEEDDSKEEDEEKEVNELDTYTVILPPAATASALWIVGECICNISNSPLFANNLEDKSKTKVRKELIRLVARAFPNMEPCEKLQGAHFASKVLVSSASLPSGSKASDKEAAMCEHILSLGRADVDPDVRDRSRFESGLIQMAVGLKHDLDALSELSTTGKKITVEKLKIMLLQKKPPSSSLPLEDEDDGDTATISHGHFRFGTLSSLVSHRARTAYLPLPPWSAKDSSDSLRDPPERTSPQQPEREVIDGWKTQSKPGGFYDSDEDSSSDESSTDLEEESTSSESSDEESSSDESSFEDGSSSEDGSDSDSDDENEVDIFSKPQQPMLIPEVRATNGGVTMPAQTKMSESLVDDATSSEDESSSEESSSEESDDEASDESDSSKEQPRQKGSLLEGSLLPMGSTTQKAPTPKPKMLSKESSGSSSLAEGLEGLVMAPLVVDNDQGDENVENDSSEWIKLVRPELGGGLMVQARYLRGQTKQKEAKLIGLDPEKVTTVCLQIKFENRRTDAGILRRIRIIQRGAPHGSISTRRIVIPQEIEALKRGQRSTATLGLDFASPSNREGALTARFDIKSDRGSNAVDIRPPVGEMLRRCKMSQSDFDTAVRRMKGIHQRAVSTFTLTDKDAQEAFPGSIVKQTCLTPLDKTWKDNKFHLVGTLPASGDNVYVVVTCNPKTGSGDITVCCDDTLASASIIDLLKHAIAN